MGTPIPVSKICTEMISSFPGTDIMKLEHAVIKLLDPGDPRIELTLAQSDPARLQALALTDGRCHRPPYSLRPKSSMPSPMPLNNLSTSSAPAFMPFAAPLPPFLTASLDACVPSFSWVTDHLAAPSIQAPASLSALLGSLPDFFASSAVLCQALASS